MLLITGLALLALGLFCGAALLLAPFGLMGLEPSLTLWALFPVLSVLGYAVFAVQAGPAQVRTVSRAASAALLLLALAAVTALVLQAASLLHVSTGMASLWFVLAVGVTLGSVGAASFRPGQGA